ncbi:putative Mg2+ transporter-C (MgtC) family protein [Pseudonocardia sediminis]|uniref:Putative Mg2+ transporter-C (MgtC) family protein n=1 Tax=Pseudonocardia sediminis TaxID=1397368 RepID=A0A4Q7UV41_PSEST|nr:MgtC/SapB family protein [Pseudonocardia sediminis]RZT84701.1 putative Mg2+ transporter-C (MgtC) family protein [Pseudonocardia sediminis]
MPPEWYSALWSTPRQWELALPVVLALVLTTVIGLEREAGAKSAGLRTHTLVGVGSAVFVLISKYGFADLLGQENIALDPSRVAAQIVSGIGFLGAGLIFVRQDAVRGLTTAATIWLAAAVGSACGAGLPLLAVVATAGHFVVTRGLQPLARATRRRRREPPMLRLRYTDGLGILRTVLERCTGAGFAVAQVSVERETFTDDGVRVAALTLLLQGRGDLAGLAGELAELDGVRSASTGDDGPRDDEEL